MKEITQADLVAITGVSMRDIDNWIARLPLKTKFKRSGRGTPRTFSRENAIEIAIIARLIQAGHRPAEAAERTADLSEDWKHNGETEWGLFFWGETELGAYGADESVANGAELRDALADLAESGAVYTIMNTGAIIRRIDQVANPQNAPQKTKRAS